jgi:hypothetical protein
MRMIIIRARFGVTVDGGIRRVSLEATRIRVGHQNFISA